MKTRYDCSIQSEWCRLEDSSIGKMPESFYIGLRMHVGLRMREPWLVVVRFDSSTSDLIVHVRIAVAAAMYKVNIQMR